MQDEVARGPFLAVPPETAGLKTSARRFCRNMWEDIEETAAGEEVARVIYAHGSRDLWAWAHDLEYLALGHVLLDCDPFGRAAARSKAADAVGDAENAIACSAEPVPLPFGVVGYTKPSKPAPEGIHCLWVTFAENVAAGLPPEPTYEPRCSAAVLLEEMRTFFCGAGHWDGTGSFHRAGLFCPQKRVVLRMAEDIGRHNCLDRLAGFCARQGLNPAEHILFISARITGSLYAKARRAGFRFMVSRGAVTSAALCLGRAQAVSLVGFCRPPEERLTVFCDAAGRVEA